MNIREAKISDALNISVLAGCVWVDTYAYTGVFDRISKYVSNELCEKKICEIIRENHVLLCENEDLLLGYAVIEKENRANSEIKTLYVLPGFKGMGVGKMLLFEALNIESECFWLSVWDGNESAIRFYRKFGFEEDGECFFDLYGDKIRNIIMRIRK